MAPTIVTRLLSKIVAPALALTLILCTGAMAQHGGGGNGGGGNGGGGNGGGGNGGGGNGGGHGAPEIDPSLAAAGIVLLVGGTLVLTSRRRPKTA